MILLLYVLIFSSSLLHGKSLSDTEDIIPEHTTEDVEVQQPDVTNNDESIFFSNDMLKKAMKAYDAFLEHGFVATTPTIQEENIEDDTLATAKKKLTIIHFQSMIYYSEDEWVIWVNDTMLDNKTPYSQELRLGVVSVLQGGSVSFCYDVTLNSRKEFTINTNQIYIVNTDEIKDFILFKTQAKLEGYNESEE